MGISRKTGVLVLVMAGIAAAAGWRAVVFVGLPNFRSGEYRALIQDFERAAIREGESPGDQTPEWPFQVPLPGNKVVATVQARGFMDIVKVKYSDEPEERLLYSYVDYSSPLAIRTERDFLYVHWVEILFRSDHWLLVYDLANRREVARRRVEYEDMPKVKDVPARPKA